MVNTTEKNLASVEPQLPEWLPNEGKLINHYSTPHLTNLVRFLKRAGVVRIRPLILARMVSGLRNPPAPVKLWAYRVSLVFESEPLLSYLYSGSVSAAVLLSDLAPNIKKHPKLVTRLLSNELSLTNFRTFIRTSR